MLLFVLGIWRRLKRLVLPRIRLQWGADPTRLGEFRRHEGPHVAVGPERAGVDDADAADHAVLGKDRSETSRRVIREEQRRPSQAKAHTYVEQKAKLFAYFVNLNKKVDTWVKWGAARGPQRAQGNGFEALRLPVNRREPRIALTERIHPKISTNPPAKQVDESESNLFRVETHEHVHEQMTRRSLGEYLEVTVLFEACVEALLDMLEMSNKHRS